MSGPKQAEGLHYELAVSLASTPEDAAKAAERRRYPRMELGLSAHCQIDGVVSQEALGDLSIGGLYLRTSAPARIGARVRVVLGLPHIGGQRVCSLAGAIVWIDKNPDGQVRGAGVEFDHETDSQDHDVLRGFLALWGTPAPRVSPAGA